MKYLLLLFISFNVLSTSINSDKKTLNQFLFMMSDIINKPIIVQDNVNVLVSVYANDSGVEPKKLLSAVLEANQLNFEETADYIIVKNKMSFSQYDKFETVVYDFNNVFVTDVIEPLNQALELLSLDFQFQQNAFKAYPANNGTSIIISAPADAIEHVNALLSIYDKPIKQVKFRVAIVETTDSDLLDIGLNFQNQYKQDFVKSNFNSSSAADNVFTFIRNVGDFTAFLSFLDSNSTSRIVSKPNVLVRSGRSSRISVGQNIPILSGQKSNQTSGDSTYQDIDRLDIGLILSIQTVVSNSGLINVKLSQELSSISRDAEAIDVITNKRLLSSDFQMVDGQTINIGGLISTQNDDIESGVPLLRDIPWVGKAFQSTKKQSTVRNLSIVMFAELI